MSEKQEEAGKESASDASDKEPKNEAVKMTVDQAFAEVENLKKAKKDQAEQIQALTAQLNEVNGILEGQEKARLIGEILPRSSYTMEILLSKSIDELKTMRATLENAMPPKLNSVRFGVGAANISDREKGLTVGDMSWSTAQRRKEAA